MKLHFYCLAIFAMMLYGCNQGSASGVQDMQTRDQTATEQEKVNDRKEDQVASADTVGTPTVAVNNAPPSTRKDDPDWDKKIIKTADLQLQLDDYKKFNYYKSAGCTV